MHIKLENTNEFYENINSNEDNDYGLWIGSSKTHLINNKFKNLFNQFKALIIKKYIQTSRNKALISAQLIFPLVLLIINIAFIKYGPIKFGDLPELSINIDRYTNNFLPFISESNDNSTQQKDNLSSLSYYLKQNLMNYSKVKIFDLKETDSITFCSTARKSIDAYLSCLGKISNRKLNTEHLTGISFNYTNFIGGLTQRKASLKITGYFSNQLYHVPPLTLNLISNTLLKHFTNNSLNSINVINHPLPRNMSDVIQEISKQDIVSYLLGYGMTFGFSFLVSSFGMFLISERVSGAKHLQYLNGCNSYVFWLSTFCWDMIIYLIPIILIMITLFVRSFD